MEVLVSEVRKSTDLKCTGLDHEIAAHCNGYDKECTDDDNCHQCTELNGKFYRQKQEMEHLCKNIQRHIARIQSTLQCLKMQENEVARHKELASKNIEVFVQQIISTIKQSAIQLQESVTAIAAQMLDSIATQKEKGEKILSELSLCGKPIPSDCSSTNDDIFKRAKVLKEQMENALQLSEHDCIQKPDTVGMCLIPNEEVLVKCRNIGEITALSFPRRKVSATGGIARCTGKGSLAAIVDKERNFTLHLPAKLDGLLSCYLYNEKGGQIIQSRVEEANQKQLVTNHRQTEHRMHKVSYTPTHHGLHFLKVLVGGVDIPCEPSMIQVLPTAQAREQHLKIYDVISPLGIAIDDEVIVVSEFDNNSVCIYDNYGQISGRFGSEGSGNGEFRRPSGIAVTPDHHIVVVDNGNHRIQRFKLYGTYDGSAGVQGNGSLEFNSPCDIAINIKGQIYVSDTGNHCIKVLHSDLTYSHRIGRYGKKPSQFSYPKGITIDSKGNLYVCDGQNSRIQKFSPSGTFMCEFGKQVLHHPRFIGVDSYNILYVTDKELEEVLMFDNDGECLGRFGAIETARGVTVDSEDNVYVCNIKRNNVCIFQNL